MHYLCTAFKRKALLKRSFGEVAEWSIAAVLKTVELRGSGGSNPSLSAEPPRQRGTKIGQVLQYQRIVGLFLLYLVRGKRHKIDPFGQSSVTKS